MFRHLCANDDLGDEQDMCVVAVKVSYVASEKYSYCIVFDKHGANGLDTICFFIDPVGSAVFYKKALVGITKRHNKSNMQ